MQVFGSTISIAIFIGAGRTKLNGDRSSGDDDNRLRKCMPFLVNKTQTNRAVFVGFLIFLTFQ